MDASGGPVKRRYDASRRRERADRRRATVVGVSERRFLRDGYTATTIAGIAAEAGVSPDTIYKSFGGKPGLVRAIRERALRGDAPEPAETRSDRVQAAERDPREIIRAWGAFVAEISPRVSPIQLLVRDAAATHPEVAALRDELDELRRDRMRENARRLRDAGHVRAGLDLEQVTDVLWTYSAPELYELLVLRRGWPPERFGRFVADAMIAAVL